VISIALQPLPKRLLPAAVALDQAALGGLWNADGYQQELERPSSDLLGLWQLPETSSHSQSLLWGMGCGWTILDETHLVLLAVHPNFRRQGLGCAILLRLLTYARHRGSNYATLEVRASNQAAIALYEKFGFKTAGRRPNYYRDASSNTSEDALILWCSGLQTEDFKAQIRAHWQSLEQRWATQSRKIIAPCDNFENNFGMK
jgi:[ribosomal protein S18]-alanine N-acetyltransferase